MVKINENYGKLPGSYLFSEVARRISAYTAAHPEAKIIKLSIGDVTRPLVPAVTEAMHKAVDEMGTYEGTHGGLVQIPFVGGVIVPNQGLFPQYDKGEFLFDNTTMIISAGLGVSNPVPRFNNQPEICVINITKGNS